MCVLTGVEQLYNLLNCGAGILYALAGQFYSRAAEIKRHVKQKNIFITSRAVDII